jgi:phytanoyl-CoA hydroxylase
MTMAISNDLSAAQLDEFAREGFLVTNDVISMAEVEALRAACENNEIDQKWKEVDRTVHSLTLTERHPLFLQLAKDPRIVSLVTQLIGPDVQLQHSKLAAKPLTKNAGPFGWHQDYAYFPHTNYELVAVMVMLDDATLDNGCMSMVRGSHKLGLLNHINDKGYFTGSCLETDHWEKNPQNVIPVTPKAGGISVHHCLTLHGSGPNLLGIPRRGLVFQYRAADAYQLADSIFPDTGVQVAGERTPYARCTAGKVRLPRFMGNGKGEFGYGSAWNQVGEMAKK